MKLLKCYISSFGKLKDVSFDFDSGLNTLKEDNGWGKSTLAGFIKAIFYGLSDNKRSVAENERIKFKPWGATEKFGGYIDFDWAGNAFRIERFFGNKASEDTVKLVDLKTGKSHSNTENLGKRIFEIDEDGFFSTVYFSQKDFQAKSNTSLTAKFSAVCEMQDSDAFDKALSKIVDKAKTYKYSGNRGLIVDTKRELYAVNERIEQTSIAARTADGLRKSVELLESEVVKLDKQSAELTEKVTVAGRAEAVAVKKTGYKELLSKNEKIVRELYACEKVLSGNHVSSEEVRSYIDCNNDLSAIEATVKNLSSDVAALESTVNEKRKARKGGRAKYFGIASALSAAIGAAAAFFNALVGIVFFVVAAILFTICLVGFFGDKKEEKQVNDGYLKMLEEKRAEHDKYVNIYKEYSSGLDAFINLFNIPASPDRYSALSYLTKVVDEYQRLKKEEAELAAALSAYKKDRDVTEEVPFECNDISALKSELASVRAQYSAKADELANKRSAIRRQSEIADELPDLESKKADINAKIAQYEEEYDLLVKTAEYMKKADENLKVRYRQPLQESLNKYLSYVADGCKALIDIDLVVSVEETDGTKVTDYYSKGYQNLFEICKRFALTDVLFTGEKPFIILDDPFYNLDDEKLSFATDLIKKLSSDYQIIYLICHESRRA